MNPAIDRLVVPTGKLGRLLLGVMFCCLSSLAPASIEFSLAIENIQGEDWQAQGITVSVAGQTVERLAIRIRLEQLELPDGQGHLKGLELECPEVVRSQQEWRCVKGRLAVQDSPIQAQDAGWYGSFWTAGRWQITIPELAIAQGRVALEANAQDGIWTALVRPHRTGIGALAALGNVRDIPRGWGLKGRASGLVRLVGRSAEVSQLDADLVVDQLAYASPDATQAAEQVVLKANVKARMREGSWDFDAGIGWPRGALYSDPLFIDTDQGALSARFQGNWHPGREHLQLDVWSLDLAKTAKVTGTGRFQGAGLAVEDLTIALQSDDAGHLYRRLLQPFLIGTAADDMTVSGRVGVVLHFDAKGIEQAGLELNRLTLEDHQGRFSLDQADGSVGWDRSGKVPMSHVNVAGAAIYRIPTGGFRINARFTDERIVLDEPVVVPVLGGAVTLDSFVLTGALMAGEKPRWEASASVRDISLEQLTRSLEWPPFNGNVTGQLRNMRYRDQVFSVGGGLTLTAFDGDIRVENLGIQDPFGAVPVLQADATMRGLNLEALTETFSFGRIEGRLDADMRAIQLVGWQPDRFDLHLYTPPGDVSRHRISQRAVENLTELGSGVPAGLSATFLSVFEEFRYDKIDLKIRLQGDVAELDGLARPDGGYYLVKGSGLPRIDVIGRNRSVAWKDLVERLQQIQVEGAQIQ